MSKIEKVKENYVFRRAYSKGKSVITPFAVIYYNKNRFGGTRLGITAGKKLGKAVYRNRAKRVVRAAFCDCLQGLMPGYDYIIVARVRILSVKSQIVTAAFKKALTDAGMFSEVE